MQAELHRLESNDHRTWSEFMEYVSPDPYDDFGWFHVTVGAGSDAGNDFQVCVATPRSVGRIKRQGNVPGIIVDCYEPVLVRDAITGRITSTTGHTWDQIVNQLRTFMLWEYEGMAGY